MAWDYDDIPNDQVASVGRQFRTTVDFLYDRRHEITCVTPLMTMAAFGIEVFLKSLNSKNVYHQDDGLLAALDGYRITAAPIKWGHSLVALYEALLEELRNELDEAYRRNPLIEWKPSFREALAVYDLLFVEGRYPFEDGKFKDGLSITHLVMLLRFVGDHVASLPKRIGKF